MGAARFGRLLTAMATPFTAAGDLDLDGAVELARWLVAHGSDGLVLAGTTGEGPTLSDDEKVELWTAVRAAVDVPLVAGSGSNDTRHTIHLSQRAAATGVDGLLIVAPYYNKPSQAGFDAHFRAVAAATELPLVLYDIPGRTGRKVDTDVLVRLANEVPTIAGVKDAAGNPGETAALISSAPDGFEVYSGDDVFTLPLLASGIVGTVGVATHWTGLDHQEMFDLWEKGDTFGARLVNSRMLESFAFETGDDAPNPIPTKAILRHQGIRVGQARLPMGDAPEFVEQRVPQVLADLQTWRDAFPERPDR
jgi:4-hydroxy-tetrahydrodipicolinate synthase